MKKIGSFEKELNHISPKLWNDFLKKHSNLPGTQVNMELAKAFAKVGTLMDFKKYIRLGPKEAPENTSAEFLTFCGVLGLGDYLSKYHDGGLLMQLRERASDPRWRIREAVVLALQTIGQKNISRLLRYAKSWIKGSPIEQQVAIAALCNSELLSKHKVGREVIDLLDLATATMIELDEEQNEEYESLRETLNDSWSEAVAVLPEKGKSKIERWIKENHPVVNSILMKNLEEGRLKDIDEKWTQSCLRRLSVGM